MTIPEGQNWPRVKTLFTKMHLKTPSAKWRPFCPGRDELNHMSQNIPVPALRGLQCYCPVSRQSSMGCRWAPFVTPATGVDLLPS